MVIDKSKDIILVTGATGRQGSAVARHLLKSGYKMKAGGLNQQDCFNIQKGKRCILH
ncbi:MAG: NmrA family NAD(P)-binding protein [Betaproteobacteria bacterium]